MQEPFLKGFQEVIEGYLGLIGLDLMAPVIYQEFSFSWQFLSVVKFTFKVCLFSPIQVSLNDPAGIIIPYDVPWFSKVSIIGVGMRTHAGVAARMFKSLAEESINIHSITTSEIKISCLIEAKYGELALRVMHDAFGLKGGAGTREMDL